MNGYYIVPTFTDREKGIVKKINYHIELFSQISEVKKIEIPNNKWVSRIIYRLPFGSAGGNYKNLLDKLIDPDYVYIRKGNVDRKLIAFLSTIRTKYPNCKILFEIPTYPYDRDALAKPQNYFILQKDKRYRKQFYKYIDRIVTYSTDDEIFGIKTIRAHNGVDCSKIKPIERYNLKADEINLIGVAQFRAQHGYERLIRGLGEYYKTNHTTKVKLTLVGNGSEMPLYEHEVEKAGIGQFVIFAGSQMGEELDRLYNEADIAISSLGMYKLGLQYVSTLKNCEYLAKGLPVVAGYDDYVLEDNPYSLRVSNDNSSIDINQIIGFFNDVYAGGKEKTVKEIREIALRKADLSQSYKDVISYILE